MRIRILGSGCRNCETVYGITTQALEEMQMQATVEKVTDMAEIVKYVMATPGVVVDEKVIMEGGPMPSVADMKAKLMKAAGGQ